MGSLLEWWAVVGLLGILALPLTFLTLKHLPDKGYAFSKILALLFVGYVGWIIGHLGYGPAVPFMAVFLLLVTSLLLLSRCWHALVDFLKAKAGYVLVVELLFLAAFLLAGAFKMRSGDITGTEKPMDFAMINGILSSLRMPPQDPWLSGGSISYYYFGYFIVAMLVKLTGVDPSVGFNLAVALIWALAAIGSFGLGYALTRQYRYAGLSTLSVTLFGNMDYWHRALQSFSMGDLRATYYHFTPDPTIPKGLPGFFGFIFSPLTRYWDYFQASRIIPVPPTEKLINEFPAFSFFLSDLHPHVMAIPFVLFALAFSFNLLKAPMPSFEIFGGRRPWQIGQIVLAAGVFGSLGFLNSWDFPTMVLILGICLAFQMLWTASKTWKEWLKDYAYLTVPIVAGAFLLYVPFYLKFQSQANGLGLVLDRTDLYYLFVLFGLFLVVVIPAVTGRALAALAERNGRVKARRADTLQCVVCGREGEGKKFCGYCGGELEPGTDNEVSPLPSEIWRNNLRSTGSWIWDPASPGRGWIVILVLGVVLGGLNLGKLNLSVLLGGLLLAFLAALTMSAKSESKEMVFATVLVFTSALLWAGCEVLYIRDHFAGGDLYRMNTVFKFHYQVWLLLSIAIAPFLKWLLEVQYPLWKSWQRSLWVLLAVLALIGAAAYPFLTVLERARNTGLPTLDGLAGFKAANPGDAGAADWIHKNLVPKDGKVPVILESWGGSYSPFARIATQTGYPTILGWDFHEAQWRGSWDKAAIRGGRIDDTVLQRRQDVDTIYTTTDLNQARDLLRKYNVDYVVVGTMERNGTSNKPGYPAAGLDKFVQLGVPVFNEAGTVIFKINP